MSELNEKSANRDYTNENKQHIYLTKCKILRFKTKKAKSFFSFKVDNTDCKAITKHFKGAKMATKEFKSQKIDAIKAKI